MHRDTFATSACSVITLSLQPATNLPPVADAGKDQSYNLPLPTVTLDGSLSRDDGNITAWQWSAVRLPAGERRRQGQSWQSGSS